MIELWIPFTIAAAFFQNLRSALQKAIKGRLSTMGAAYARFFYAWPLALLYLWAIQTWGGAPAPQLHAEFFLWCFAGGLVQILFTVVLLWMFSFRSFAVGTTFSKLEVVLIAFMGAVLLGDTVGPIAIVAIAIGAVGTVILAMTESKLSPGALLRGMGEKATWIGLLCAALLGASVVFFRGAALSLEGTPAATAAAYALAVALVMQTIGMGVWFMIYDRPQLLSVVREWRAAAPAGIVGMLGSVCWFTAFTLENAAYVRAVGQIELVFTFVASVFFFREKVRGSEVVGILLIVAAILLIVLGEAPPQRSG
ncbi:MAG: DMT family transporter [Pseudomonadota bacterium]